LELKDSFLVSIIQLIFSIFTNMRKNEYRLLGVMSGTSLDGIDLIFTEFDFRDLAQFRIIYSETIPYSEEWQDKLKNSAQLDAVALHQLDLEYTEHLSKVILKFIAKHELDLLDAICSHGHTVKHRPGDGITYQIGNLPGLAQDTGIPVVCDFRVQDVELGGQGAPLVPIGDRYLFGQYEFCMNLGGFANISYEDDHGARMAFDICAVNTVLNHYMKQRGKDYDHEGALARTGKIHREMLSKLNALHYFTMPAPKSLGIEWVRQYIFPLIDSYSLAIPDILRTFIEHIAIQIANCLPAKTGDEVLVTGGGSYNLFLMERIRQYTPCKVFLPDNELIEFKEALIFAFLGALRLRGEINILCSVTGAKMDHSSGRIYRP